MASKDSEIKTVDVASDESLIIREEQVEKDAQTKKIIVVATDDSCVTKEEQVEKDSETKNVVVASDDSGSGKEEVVEKDVEIKNVVVASDDSVSEEEDEKETGIDLGLSMDKLKLGPKKKLLVLPIGGFLVHRAHRRRPKTIPKRRQPDFSLGNFMSSLESRINISYSPIYNSGIFPMEYDPENNQDDFLSPNGELRVFLDGLAEANDVQTYVKDNRIGEPGITSSHANWDFYFKIVRAYGKNN
ncbi:hypothetical protein L1987_84363 [Smallanthus sonchifolius]|uniref:Uncharacterized protein n=1 Tax=Smallanthus sonchifolius TaxID=185202 RepID=A0ACB8YFF6_9ASTR|nr:hypothetical protein L1987_84363 [Smallanthus sonchifolius]